MSRSGPGCLECVRFCLFIDPLTVKAGRRHYNQDQPSCQHSFEAQCWPRDAPIPSLQGRTADGSSRTQLPVRVLTRPLSQRRKRRRLRSRVKALPVGDSDECGPPRGCGEPMVPSLAQFTRCCCAGASLFSKEICQGQAVRCHEWTDGH